MELEQGYTQTEVGAIPKDWVVRRLGEVGECLIGLTYSPEAVRRDGLLVLRASNIEDGSLSFDDSVFVEAEVPDRIIVRRGDILICVRNGSRELIGKCTVIDKRAEGMTFGAFMAVFRTSLHDFVHQQFQSDTIRRQIHARLGATINQITNRDLASFLVPLPSREDEQRAIAAALDDADGLTGALGQLISKKRDLKQAATQQLLTRQRRLPGFRGEWEVVRFGELASPRRDRVDPRKVDVHFCVELEHIGQGSGRLLGSSSVGENSSQKTAFQAGDVLFGKLRAYLRKYWLADRPGACSTEIWALVAKQPRMIPEFLLHVVAHGNFIEAARTSHGTHMPRSDWDVVKNYQVRLPQPDEQVAIAAVLSDMDSEIAALEARRDKTRALKHAMMQELLTGRTRLV